MASYGDSVLQVYSWFWREMRTSLPSQQISTCFGSCRILRISLQDLLFNEISQPFYITASEVLLTCDRDNMSPTILSNCVGIMYMRLWSCLGEKTSYGAINLSKWMETRHHIRRSRFKLKIWMHCVSFKCQPKEVHFTVEATEGYIQLGRDWLSRHDHIGIESIDPYKIWY